MAQNNTHFAALENIREDDMVIVFMGLPGSGKTRFINLLSGQNHRRPRNSLKSHIITTIFSVADRRPEYSGQIALLDIPAFDDTGFDSEILYMIASLFEKLYRKKVKSLRLVYLHRITDNRMVGPATKNLRMLGAICGDMAMDQVTFVTTMWEKPTVNEEIGARREEELKRNYWAPMIEGGARVDRLQTATPDAAWRVIHEISNVRNKGRALLLQEELVDVQMRPNETHAGTILRASLRTLLVEQEKILKSLQQEMRRSNNRELIEELQAEVRKVKGQLQATSNQIKHLKYTVGQRVRKPFLSKTQARPVELYI